MADNLALPPSGATAATDKVTYSGDANVDVQLTRIVQVTGAEGSKTVVDLPGDATNGLDVDVTRVQGTVAVTQSGTWDEVGINDSGNSITVDNATISVVGTGTEATAQRVTIASDSTGVLSIDDNGGNISIDDGGNTITVDGTVTVGTMAALVAGSANIGDVDVLTIAAGDNNIGNVDIVTVPSDPFGASADASSSAGGTGTMSAKLRLLTLQVSTASTGMAKTVDAVAGASDVGVPSLAVRDDALAVLTPADGDYVPQRTDSMGRLWTNGDVDPALAISKSFNATTTQTGIDVWDPAAGKKIAITSVVIGTYGTTAARVILWFGDNADTTYSAGTDQVLLAASFAPSATVKPGLVFTPSHPVFCNTADRELHITTDAGISIDVVCHGFEY